VWKLWWDEFRDTCDDVTCVTCHANVTDQVCRPYKARVCTRCCRVTQTQTRSGSSSHSAAQAVLAREISGQCGKTAFPILEQFKLQRIADVAVIPGVREEGIRGFVCFRHWRLSQAQIRWWWCHHYLAFWPGKYISLAGEYKLQISPSDGAEGGARLQPAETQGVGGEFSPETEICSKSHG